MNPTPTPTPIHPHQPGRRLVVALGLAAALAVSACSDDSPQQATVKSSADVAAQDETTTTVDDSGEGTDDVASTDDAASTTTASDGDGDGDGEVLGSSTGAHRADPNDDTQVPLRLDVGSVERLPGEVIEVRFTITNVGDTTTYELWRTLADPDSQGYDAGGAALVDAPNDKRYLTLYDSGGTCLCTGGSSDLAAAPGESMELYVQLTAPPEDVTEVGFTLPGFAPINGLEIR